MSGMAGTFGILVHGGAGNERKESLRVSKALLESTSAGFAAIKTGSALDGVEEAVANMEDSGLFNAGAGSCLTLDRKVEMDASVMDGRDLTAGSVGMVQSVKNPVRLARLVMDRTDHVMLVSDGAERLAKILGVETVQFRPDRARLDKYSRLRRQMKIKWKKNYRLLQHYGTVGAVAIDKDGNVASAVSTGGRWLKIQGRIGDSAIIGAGLYADNRSGAACATGSGELMMRLCLCKKACDLMRSRGALQSSAKAIQVLTKQFGQNTGGMITVDRRGRFGASTNTESMPVALESSAGRPLVAFSRVDLRRLFSQ